LVDLFENICLSFELLIGKKWFWISYIKMWCTALLLFFFNYWVQKWV